MNDNNTGKNTNEELDKKLEQLTDDSYYKEEIMKKLDKIDVPPEVSDYTREGINKAKSEKQKKMSPLKRAGVIASALTLVAAVTLSVIFVPSILASIRQPANPDTNPELIITTDAGDAEKTNTTPTEGDGAAEQAPPASLIAESAIGEVVITPVATPEENSSVYVNSTFKIQTKEATTPEQLAKELSINDEDLELSVIKSDKESDTDFELTFNEPLKHNKVYKIVYASPNKRPLSFAFQTEEKLCVVSALPANNTYGVTLDHGIEIKFNEEIESGIEEHFTIAPAVKGRFEQVGTTYIFIPAENLAPSTVYSITLSKDMVGKTTGTSMDEDYVLSFGTAESSKTSDAYISVARPLLETFLPEDEIVIEMNVVGEYSPDSSFRIDVSSVDSAEVMLGYIKDAWDISEGQYPGSVVDTQQPKITPDSFAAPILTVNTDLYTVDIDRKYYYSQPHSYLLMGQTLPEGLYALTITHTKGSEVITQYKFIQVSALSVYSLSVEDELCVWVNDTATGKPAVGAEVSIDGMSYKTGESGAVLVSGMKSEQFICKVKYGAYREFVYISAAFAPTELKTSDKYYAYMYTDRPVYKPTDTVQVFGVINARYDEYNLALTDIVEVKIGDMYSKQVVVDDNGCFTAIFDIEDMSSNSSGYVQLYINGSRFENMYNYIEFADIENRRYVVDAKLDKLVLESGENLEVALDVSTYDGAPVEDVEFELSSYHLTNGSPVSAATDVTGAAIISLNYNSREIYKHYAPYSDSVIARTTGLENSSSYIYKSVMFIPRDIMHGAAPQPNGDIEVQFNKVNAQAIRDYVNQSSEGVNSYISEDVYRAEAVDVRYAVNIYKTTYTRTVRSEYYDHIQKRTITVYDYDSTTELSDTLVGMSADGKAIITDIPKDEEYVYYRAELIYPDSRGYEIVGSINGNNGLYTAQNPTTIRQFRIDPKNAAGEYTTYFGTDEEGTLTIRDYDQQTSLEGSMLAIFARDGIISVNHSDTTTVPFTFTSEMVSNAWVFGAYFDGKKVYPTYYPLGLYFLPDEKELDISMEFDKEVYSPGDIATVRVQLTNKDGTVPSRATVNLSVVDESSFFPESYSSQIVRTYYSSIHRAPPIYMSYTSYTQHEFSANNGAEMGGGGGEAFNIRKDFADNPCFDNYITGTDGIATITFKLADAVTSWRVTANAVARGGFVGTAKKNIVASMPLYINPVMADEYLVGDEITLAVKTYGSEYSLRNTEVEYYACIKKGDDVIAEQTVTSNSYGFFTLPSLEAGDYIVFLTAKAGELTDAVELPITVIAEGMKLDLQDSFVLAQSEQILPEYEITSSPVTVTMTNASNRILMNVLGGMVKSNSLRYDHQASRKYVSTYIQRIAGNAQEIQVGDYMPRDAEFRSYQKFGMPISRFDGGAERALNEGLGYTARFAAAFPELLDEYEIGRYLRDVENNLEIGQVDANYRRQLESDRAAYYLIRASMGESVLLEIKDQIALIYTDENQEQFSADYYQQLRVLYYSYALCVLGDDAGAYELMSKYPMSETILGEFTDEQGKQAIREELNALIFAVNTTVNPAAAFEYVETNGANIYCDDTLERITFVKNYVPAEGFTSSIAYTLNGEHIHRELKGFESINLTLTKEQFAVLNLEHIENETCVWVRYTGGASNLSGELDVISLEKTLMSNDRYVGEGIVTNGAVCLIEYEVRMPRDAQSGYYTIRDRLPSNMVLALDLSTIEDKTYLRQVDKHFVEYSFYYEKGLSHDKTMNFALRVINDSKAVISDAYVSQTFDMDTPYGKSK